MTTLPAPPSREGPGSSKSTLWTILLGIALLGLTAFRRSPAAPVRGQSEGQARPAVQSGDKRGKAAQEGAVAPQRAREPGRGREADKPTDIPPRGWKDILWRTYEEMNNDRILAVAAGVTFYGLLALFPAIAALVSIYGLFADAATINDHLSLLAGFLPGGAIEIVSEQVKRIASKGSGTLGFGFVFGLVISLWSANAGMKAMFDALNVAYGEEEKRSFIGLNLRSLAFTMG